MNTEGSIYRVLDANLNRASEGLRVLEDVARFMYDDARLTQSLKQLRHAVLSCGARLGAHRSVLASRQVAMDVGKDLEEARRGRLRDLIKANCRRVEQALRSLEEYGKLISPSSGDEFRKMRFQVYELESHLVALNMREADYRLYAVTQTSLPCGELLTRVRCAVAAGITALQLREKTGSLAEFLQRAKEIRRIVPGHVVFIVNDRVDVAMASGADGVHLGQDDLPVGEARKLVGEGMIIGCSTHTPEQAREAVRNGADYVAVGPVFFTDTKKDVSGPVGPEMIRQIRRMVQVPIVGIGGITAGNVPEVFAAGADGVACVSAVFGGSDTAARTSALLRAVNACL